MSEQLIIPTKIVHSTFGFIPTKPTKILTYNFLFIASVTAALCISSPQTQAACPAAGNGITIAGAGNTAVENNCIISTTLPLRYGVQATTQAEATLNNGSITTTGNNAHGTYALNGGIVNVNGAPITVSGNAYGAYAINNNATVNLTNLDINMSTAISNGVGLNATDSGRIFADNITITTNSDNGHGASAMRSGALVDLANSRITIQGLNSYGVSSTENTSLILHDNSQVTTLQDYNHGAYVRTAAMTIDNSQITTQGLAAYALYARNLATADVLNGTTLTTTGNSAYGVLVSLGSTVNMTDSAIETSNLSAVGAYTFSGGTFNLTNSSITTHGGNAYAYYATAPAATVNTFTATDSTLISDNAATFLLNGGTTNVTLTNVQNQTGNNILLLVSGTAIAVPNLGIPYDILPFDPNSLQGPTGVSAQDNTLNIGANPGIVTILSNGSTLTGNSFVSNNSTVSVTLDNSTTLTGAFNTGPGSTTNMTLQNGSTWFMTDSSNVTNLVNSGSLIDFVAGPFKTLTTVNYTGIGGSIGLNTFLDTDGSPSDLLVIDSGTAIGTTALFINNAGGTGAATQNNGILVVDAINGATTASTAFSLGAPVIAGPYEYLLFYGSQDGSGPQNWYLRSTSGNDDKPNYREEVSLYAALPSVSLLYGQLLLDSLHARVGEEQQLQYRSDLTEGRSAWARYVYRDGNINDDDIFNKGPDFNYHFNVLQVGSDLYRQEHHNGSRDHIGLYIASGHGKANVEHVNGKEAGIDKLDAMTLGAYWTHFGSTGWYLDGILQKNWYDLEANSGRIAPLLPDADDFAASLEGGFPFRFWNRLVIEPQGQAIYQRLAVSDSTDEVATIRFGSTSGSIARLGLRIANDWLISSKHSNEPQRIFTAWIRANKWYQYGGSSKTEFSSENGFVPFPSELSGRSVELELGMTGQVTRTVSLYGKVSHEDYNDDRGRSFAANAGLRVNL